MKNKKLRNDIILVTVILLIAVTGILFINLNKKTGTDVVVNIDGTEKYRYSLSEDITVDIKTGDNGEHVNTLVIENSEAYVSYADCPDGICTQYRAVSYAGESIICLPHKVVIEIQAAENSNDLDIVA